MTTAQSSSVMLSVEVGYASPDKQSLIALSVPAGTTALQAAQHSGITQRHPELSLAQATLGIFGKKTDPHTVLKAYDRVEIYRPLVANPKEARRQRVAAKKQKPPQSGRP